MRVAGVDACEMAAGQAIQRLRLGRLSARRGGEPRARDDHLPAQAEMAAQQLDEFVDGARLQLRDRAGHAEHLYPIRVDLGRARQHAPLHPFIPDCPNGLMFR